MRPESNSQPACPTADGDEAAIVERFGQRTAMFVAATCVSKAGVQPVRVRNLSRTGALLEAGALPEPGVEFELVRANLRVSARSMWVRGTQCGASFDAPVDVAEWMSRPSPGHQQQVDSLVFEARLAMAAGRSDSPEGDGPKAPVEAEPIRRAIALLEQLDGALADDPLVVARHHERLQMLDRALQILRRALNAPGA